MPRNAFTLSRDSYTGKKLGKYEVICRLSEGGMSTLFLALARGAAGFSKLVVLKRVLPGMAGQRDFVKRFLEEARVMAGFSHPYIAQVFDLDQADKDYFLAMEFVPGATLLEIVNACIEDSEQMPSGLALAAVRDTALALHYAHTYVDPLGESRRIIHRDIAPKNVMVTYDGATKLLDFGIAKAQASRGAKDKDASQLTQIGMVIGTPGYMSPEQALGQELDGRSDVFSLGVTLFECITGRRLYARNTPDEEMRAPFEADPPLPSQMNRRLPLRLDALVLKALARKKEERYATALEFAKAIEQVGGDLLWAPDKRADMVQRLFSERRAQTRSLLQALKDAPEGQEATVINFPTFPSTARPAERPPDRPDVTVPSAPAFRKDHRPDNREASKGPSGKGPPPPAKLLQDTDPVAEPAPEPATLKPKPAPSVRTTLPDDEDLSPQLLEAALGRRRWGRWLGVLAVLLLGGAGGWYFSPWAHRGPLATDPKEGRLTLTTEPAAVVRVGQRVLGRTPLEVHLAEGSYRLILESVEGGNARELPIDIHAEYPMALKFKLEELPEADRRH